MNNKSGNKVKIGDKISINKDKQPVFEVIGFRGENALVKCIDDKGENFYFDTDTLLIPQSALLRYETIEEAGNGGV